MRKRRLPGWGGKATERERARGRERSQLGTEHSLNLNSIRANFLLAKFAVRCAVIAVLGELWLLRIELELEAKPRQRFARECVCGRVAGCHNDIIIYINEISAISQKRREEDEQGVHRAHRLRLHFQLLVRLSLRSGLIYGQFLLVPCAYLQLAALEWERVRLIASKEVEWSN